MNLFEADERGMVRRNDHSTSIRAAKRVVTHRNTLKAQVIAFTRESGPYGVIDEELHAIDPTRPESSFRKRRTELAQKNILIEKPGHTRKNRHGEDCKVFIHRDHAFNPPPICDAPPAISKFEAGRLAERVAVLRYLAEIDGRASHCYALDIKNGAHLK
jgi:hypothetical protein